MALSSGTMFVSYRRGPDLRQIDYLLLGTTLLIAIAGVFAIKSALHGQPDGIAYARKQVVGILIGLGLMIGLGVSDYSRILPRYSRWMYWGNIAMLALVIKLGHSSHGAQRWIHLGPIELQPSEFAKIILIVCLALFLVRRRDEIREWKTVLGSLGFILVPLLLIFKQPDLGTALVVLALWFGMMFIAGARWQHLTIVLVTGCLLFAGMWHFHILKDYQKQRLEVFLNPNADPRDTGYHLRQSQIAIGSGQVTGEGYEHGKQANGHFIPEQHTDFIFTIVGEETGFVGAVVLLALYLLLLERGIAVMIDCEDYLGRLLAAGCISMLAFHIVINVGMTIGVMPVTGVPLPFFSYGLSALLVDMTAIGILLSIAARKHRTMF